MNYINNGYYYRYYYYYYNYIEIATKWELGVNIPGIVLQFLGLYGAHKEHEQAVGWYGLLMALIAGLSIASGLWSDFLANFVLTALYFICSCLALTFAYEMRRRRLNTAISRAWHQSSAGIIPMHTTANNNVVYTTPAATMGGQTTVIGGGQYQQSAVMLPMTTTATQFGSGNHGGVIQMISPASMIQPTTTTMMSNTYPTVYQQSPGPATVGGNGGQIYPLNPGASGGGQYVEHPPSYLQSETTDRQYCKQQQHQQ
ncbi:uncharacterized protein LOC128956904 [Oppia nitens]|uniref:uncharacterized protein LOC128956904 n=1 Tax=Oppia nitens TaxID=1686743 RepID=UPI0023DA1FD4|nr:uncharacterized protein LOC128956904 [Oppia nitens]